MDDEATSCRYCDKQILKKNYELHKLRCGVLNRARRINTMPQENQKEEEGRKKINLNLDDVYRQLQESEIKEQEKKIKKVSPKKQRLETESFLREERIPCHICGYLQSLSQLDTHSQSCKGEGMICNLCEQFVPLQKIELHQIICPKKKAIKQNVHFQKPKQVRQINKQKERNNIPEIQKRRIPRKQARNEFEQMRQMRELIRNMSRLGKQNQERLPESHFSKLISFAYKPHGLNDDSCSICYCNYQQGEEILLLPCAHLFHAVCVKQWLKNNCKCPYCKEKVKFRK